MNGRSESIDKIMGALAKAQGTYKKLNPNQETPSGTFANLSAILDAVKQPLADNGLGFYQHIELLDEGSGAALLHTVLGHESGQWISSSARVVAGKTDRSTGNIYEIHKRFHALMVLGIAPSQHDPLAFDDNGELLAEQYTLDQLKKPKKDKEIDTDHTLTKDRYNDLLIELDGYDDIAKGIMETYDVETLADLPNSEYHTILAKIRKLKKTHDEYLRRKS